jgi:hypothetical protein
MHNNPQGVTFLEDSARREANHADNERRHARKQRRWLRSNAQAATRVRGRKPLLSHSPRVIMRRRRRRRMGR